LQGTPGNTRAVAKKTVNYFWPVLKGAAFEDEELTELEKIIVEIQALGINLQNSLGVVKFLLGTIIVIGLVALIHFW
jgi:hypothetical protein